MGTLEAYLAAPLVALAGPSVLGAARCRPSRLYALFLLARLAADPPADRGPLVRAAGRRRRSRSAPTGCVKNQLIAGGGYPEMNPAGAALALLALRPGRRPAGCAGCRAGRRWGLLAGLMLWVDPLVLPYVGATGAVLVALPAAGARAAGPASLLGPARWSGRRRCWCDSLAAGRDPLAAVLAASGARRGRRLGRPAARRAACSGRRSAWASARPGRCATWQLWWALALPVLLAARRRRRPGGALRRAGAGLRRTGVGVRAARGRRCGWPSSVAAVAALAAYTVQQRRRAHPGGELPLPVLPAHLRCRPLLWPLWTVARRRPRPAGRRRPRWSRPVAVLRRHAARHRAPVATWPVPSRTAPAARADAGPARARWSTTLRELGVRHVRAGYWTCNRLTFASARGRGLRGGRRRRCAPASTGTPRTARAVERGRRRRPGSRRLGSPLAGPARRSDSPPRDPWSPCDGWLTSHRSWPDPALNACDPSDGPRRDARLGSGRSAAGVGRGRPRRWASAAASTRLVTSSLAMIRETCTLAVFGEMNSCSAIRLLLCPSATSRSTSCSRAVSRSAPGRPGRPRRPTRRARVAACSASGRRAEPAGDRGGLRDRLGHLVPLPGRGGRLGQRQQRPGQRVRLAVGPPRRRPPPARPAASRRRSRAARRPGRRAPARPGAGRAGRRRARRPRRRSSGRRRPARRPGRRRPSTGQPSRGRSRQRGRRPARRGRAGPPRPCRRPPAPPRSAARAAAAGGSGRGTAGRGRPAPADQLVGAPGGRGPAAARRAAGASAAPATPGGSIRAASAQTASASSQRPSASSASAWLDSRYAPVERLMPTRRASVTPALAAAGGLGVPAQLEEHVGDVDQGAAPAPARRRRRGRRPRPRRSSASPRSGAPSPVGRAGRSGSAAAPASSRRAPRRPRIASAAIRAACCGSTLHQVGGDVGEQPDPLRAGRHRRPPAGTPRRSSRLPSLLPSSASSRPRRSSRRAARSGSASASTSASAARVRVSARL